MLKGVIAIETRKTADNDVSVKRKKGRKEGKEG